MIIFKNLPDTTTPINETNLNSNFNEVKPLNALTIEDVTFDISVNGNSRVTYTVYGVAKSGYTPLGIVGIDFSNNYFAPIKYMLSGDKTKAYVNVYNLGATATGTGTIKVLYVKN